MIQVAAILLSAVLAAGTASIALAQAPPPTRSAIPAQPLDAALDALARQNGLQLVYVSEIAAGRRAPGVPAGLPVREAFTRVLEGSGLSFEFINERTVRIFTSESSSRPTRAVRTSALMTAAPQTATNTGDVVDRTASDAGTAPASLTEVVVTARKREESLLTAPLSVQAFTAGDIEAAGLRGLEDVATLTPGLNFQKLGNSQAGRYNTAIRFRGLELLVNTPSSQTGALFVDGISVPGGAGSIGFSDVERIEVIRGPQAAYFGRGTFGGAINYVTVDPADEFRGRISAEYSPNFGSNAYSASVEGPLANGLTARLSASSETRGAMFTATDGGELGEERTDMVNATLLWTPTDDLRVKLRGVYGEDNDGPASTTYVSFERLGNCRIGTPISVSTTAGEIDTTLRRNLQCGAVPVVPVTNNSTFYTVNTSRGVINTRDILVGNALGLPGTGTPVVESFGLESIFHLYSLATEYDIGDAITLTGLFGYNERATSQIRDDDNYDSFGRVTRGFLTLETESAEVRIDYDAQGRWRALLGANYYSQKQRGDVDGGISVLTNLFGAPTIGTEGGAVDSNDIETTGVFGSLEFDVFDWLTLAAEGRYQVDELVAIGGRYPGPYTRAPTEEYTDFLPRFLATVKPAEGTTLYASYSEGALPGFVNAVFATLTPAEQEAIVQIVPGLAPTIDSQTLESYEVGWKQRFADGRAGFSISAYRMDWSNVPGSAQITFISPSTGNPISTGVGLPGDVEVQGVEAEIQWSPLSRLDLRASVGYIDATYDDFVSAGLNSYFGVPAGTSYKADGNTLPRSPRETAALSATWRDQLSTEWDWYARGDATYSGKAYTDETNLSWIEAFELFNLRLGLTREDGLNVELFCTNCANETGWRTGRRGVDFGDTSPLPNTFSRIGAIVQPIERREFGVRFQYDF